MLSAIASPDVVSSNEYWISLCWQKKHESSTQSRGSHVTAYGFSLENIKNKSELKIEPWSRLQDTDLSWEKLFPKLTRNDLFER